MANKSIVPNWWCLPEVGYPRLDDIVPAVPPRGRKLNDSMGRVYLCIGIIMD